MDPGRAERASYTAFDEALKEAIPARPTPAEDMLGLAEEWSVTVSGDMDVDSSHATAPDSGAVTGTIGYSECAGGNGSDPCPFYVGSMELELTETVTLEFTCSGATFEVDLEALEIELVQPGFGIAQEAGAQRGFPPGSLIFRSQGTLDTPAGPSSFSTLGPNIRPMQVEQNGGSITVLGSWGAWIDVSALCVAETIDLDISWDLSTASAAGSPPSIEIDVPATVTCPDEIALDYTATDPDQDIDSVRWLADGVLLEASLTELDFTAGHTLTAIVRDTRGATHSDTEVVSCQ